MHIQIYSIQTAEEALAVAEAGADRIGILVTDPTNPNHYPCEISPGLDTPEVRSYGASLSCRNSSR